jgi:hypothetical protein
MTAFDPRQFSHDEYDDREDSLGVLRPLLAVVAIEAALLAAWYWWPL